MEFHSLNPFKRRLHLNPFSTSRKSCTTRPESSSSKNFFCRDLANHKKPVRECFQQILEDDFINEERRERLKAVSASLSSLLLNDREKTSSIVLVYCSRRPFDIIVPMHKAYICFPLDKGRSARCVNCFVRFLPFSLSLVWLFQLCRSTEQIFSCVICFSTNKKGSQRCNSLLFGVNFYPSISVFSVDSRFPMRVCFALQSNTMERHFSF